MVSVFRILAGLCALIFTFGPAWAEDRVTVFAAASLRGALEAVLESHTGEVTVSYGGSGQIARQVAQGAPADVVILANVAWMDWLVAGGSVDPETRIDLLGNRLVLIGPAGAEPMADITSAAVLTRLQGGRLAIGHTQAVPAGIYARIWMETADLWTDLRPHLAETENVRAALALVSRGEAPLGVVYASDAQADPGVGVLARIDPALHPRIVYPMALVGRDPRPQAHSLIDHLQSDRARTVFLSHGFLPPEGAK